MAGATVFVNGDVLDCVSIIEIERFCVLPDDRAVGGSVIVYSHLRPSIEECENVVVLLHCGHSRNIRSDMQERYETRRYNSLMSLRTGVKWLSNNLSEILTCFLTSFQATVKKEKVQLAIAALSIKKKLRSLK